LRRTELIRALVRENRSFAGDLIAPLFVCPGKRVRREIPSMPGQFNLSVDEAVAEAQEVRSLGLPAVILFGVPEVKDARAFRRVRRPPASSRKRHRPSRKKSTTCS